MSTVVRAQGQMREVVAEKVGRVNQSAAARELGLSRAYVSLVLRGKRGVSLRVGVELSRRVGVSAEELWEYLEGVGQGQQVEMVN